MNDSGSGREHAGRDSTSLAQLHIAEYEALATRNSYLITLQYSLLPAAVLIVTLFAQMWSANKDHNELLVWAVYASLLMVGIVWVDTLWEIYNNVWYVERELKPLISKLCGINCFLGLRAASSSTTRHEAYDVGTRTPCLGRRPVFRGLLPHLAV